MDPRFPKLFSPLTLRGVTLKNRIFSTGHDTNLAAGGLINDRLVAYHRARAAGGAGPGAPPASGAAQAARHSPPPPLVTPHASVPAARRSPPAGPPWGPSASWACASPAPSSTMTGSPT